MQNKSMRITSIDGMRAVFALWVVVGHVIGNTGLTKSDFSIGFKYVLTGTYAVDLFIIISGFVIFFLLDKKKEKYSPYITRRFFRLFPVSFILFLIAIPACTLIPDNAESYAHLFVSKPFPHLSYLDSWWANIELHVVSHLLMLHGMIPETVLPTAPIAFLPLAWSISLEWQFYLLAPLFFYMSKRLLIEKENYAGAIAFLFFTLFAAIIIKAVYPTVLRGAFLPYKIHFFIIGWASYFLSRYLSFKNVDRDLVLLICLLIASVIAYTTKAHYRVNGSFPFVIWLLLFPFVITSKKGWLVARLSPILDNKTITYVGKISYSIYLSHRLLIIFIMKAVSPFAHELNSMQFLWILMPTTIISTLVASAFLYRFIEAPGMKLGAKISHYFTNDRQTLPNIQSGEKSSS